MNLKNNSTGFSESGLNETEINTKDFEQKAEEHYQSHHETDVQRKIKALMNKSEEQEDVKQAQAKEEKARPDKDKDISHVEKASYFRENDLKDSIDEKIDKCFFNDKDPANDNSLKPDKNNKNSGTKIKQDTSKNIYAAGTPDYEEYKSVSQNTEIMGRLKKRLSAALKNLGIVLLLATGSLIFDFSVSGGNGPAFLQPGKYTTVFSLVSLQLMLFCVMFSMDSLSKGMKSFSNGNPCPEATAFLTVVVAGLHAVLTSVFLAGNAKALTFCSIGSFAIFMMNLHEYLKLRSVLMSFQVVSLKDTKYIANKCGSDCEEAEIFSEYINEKSEILQIDNCGFIDGFFKNSCQVSKNDRSVPLMSALSLVVSAVIFAVVLISTKEIYTAFSSFVASFCALAPLSVFICNSLPMFFAQKRVFRLRSAIVGQTACEKFNSVAAMSFDDTLVFPPKGVKVVKIRAFGDYKIDEAVVIVSKVFKTAGGPLSLVFDNMISSSETSGGAVLKAVNTDGIVAYTDGKEYLIGTKSYISLYGIDTPADEFDTTFISNAGSILYLASKTEIIGKFYIKYSLNNRFEELLKVLYKEGICAGIRTIDPCINNDLVIAKVPNTKCPVSVVKKKDDKKQAQTIEGKEAVLVSASTAGGFLHTFVVSSKLKQIFGANYVLKVLGFLVTAICFLCFAVTGNAEKISLLGVLLMQLIWILPVAVISLFYKWK